ncbi:autotransporter domain-containing protein [Erythrobacter sp. HL-111]|uniref:autotransporter domain-containing protein n=1 Tax=Erythrobacter sp. HL-111 TaxID=1798193 RepID=UPI0006D9B0FC|nr:autotransporter domain-containing protein [Erythrobacter sp. HL-111]KPP92911.1 MAG: Autotransporter beta-domain [Erythrobacteraceae bacterium HL-111]SDT01404.1 outer membrane autotransporter barrel domain-containing protein [Erythrobacter sp. HL-111]
MLEAQGTFQGFRLDPRRFEVAVPDASVLPDFRVRRTLEGKPVPPQSELIVRDDVGVDFGDPDNLVPSAVQLFRLDGDSGGIFFNCTGTLINPRTVLSAAHCFNSAGSETYGLPFENDSTILVAPGQSSEDRLFTFLGGSVPYSEGGMASSTDVVIHPAANQENIGLPFPWADVAFIALDEPITDVPTLPVLLSPLAELTRVIQVGYGTNGTGSEGAVNTGDPFLRRVGENMLGAIASPADLLDTAFPAFAPTRDTVAAESQAFYFTDFDNPDRTPEQQAGCIFEADGISCADLDAVRAIDWFDGDALPQEAGTAPGDSGSALIVADLYDFPVVSAVLSGGFDFFGLGSSYGDVSFYNPLYPFFEFITENTPYKYVSAQAGDGNWSDPDHWTQDLDPGFFIDDGSGNLVNAIPTGNEPGIFEAGPKLGTILGQDISGNSTAPTASIIGIDTSLPESSALLGPGSTGFVPNNTDGNPGTAFAAPAQYFDVMLNREGRTTVDIDVEIDKLSLDHGRAQFVLPTGRSFTTIIGYEQLSGLARIDGRLAAATTGLFGGLLEGTGTIASDVVANVGAGVAPGGVFGFGTLTVDGDYIQASGGALLIDAGRQGRRSVADLLAVTGDASLAGELIVTAPFRTRFGDEFSVLTANSIAGEFDATTLVANRPVLFAESRVEGNEVIVTVNARSLRRMFRGNRNLQSVGAAVDTLRFDGRFAEFVGLFDVIDGSGIASLVPTLSSLAPVNAFGQSATATNFSQRFTGQISQRTLALRGGNRAAAGFSPAGGAVNAIAQSGPSAPGQLGFFSTVSGSFLVTPEQRNTGMNALEEAAFTQAGELTLGADMRMTEDFTFGFAMTSVRNGMSAAGAQPRGDDTNVSGAAYAALEMGRGFTDAYLGFSRQDLGIERASAGDFRRAFGNARANAEGRQIFGGMRLGYAFGLLPGLEAGPVASVDYVSSDLGGYTEFGAGQFGLTVLDRNFTSVGAKAGLMASLDTGIGRKGRLSAFGSVAYSREVADTVDEVTAHFAGAEDVPFSIVNPLDPEWVSVTAGADFALGSRFTIGLSAHSDLGRGVLSNDEARVNVGFRF